MASKNRYFKMDLLHEIQKQNSGKTWRASPAYVLGEIATALYFEYKEHPSSDIRLEAIDIANKISELGTNIREYEIQEFKKNGIKESSRRLDARENT